MVSNVLLLALALVTSNSGSRSRDLTERVDLIELNHFYDELGRNMYDQVIFYEWSPDYRRFHVIAWCLVENDLSRMPTKVAGSDDYVVRWHDRDAKTRREVRASLYRETWSRIDPERANKKLLDEKLRTSLIRVPQRESVR
jgi:hypothetical protein